MSTFPPTIIPLRMITWSDTPIGNGSSATTFPAGQIVADSVIEERSADELVITENPVEQGSVINDHAYDLPQDLDLVYVWASGSPQAQQQQTFLQDTYQQVLSLKQAKILVSVFTGKRQYQNMLIKGISLTTDKDTENILELHLTFKQILLAITSTVNTSSTSAAQQSIPAKTMPTINGGTQSLQPAPNYNSGNPNGS